MRVTAAALILATIAPNLAQAQTTYITPGYPTPYQGTRYSTPYPGNGFASPYPPVVQGVPGMTQYSGSVASGTYPPGARTCVAQEQVCAASAPNTVGNPCACVGRDGQPSPGMVR